MVYNRNEEGDCLTVTCPRRGQDIIGCLLYVIVTSREVGDCFNTCSSSWSIVAMDTEERSLCVGSTNSTNNRCLPTTDFTAKPDIALCSVKYSLALYTTIPTLLTNHNNIELYCYINHD